MTELNNGLSALPCRRALEALRNGVPNREAVQLLGCTQPQAERQFQDLLSQASDPASPPAGALGMLVSGDFGTGKSHLLSHFEHRALSQGFVCSKVAISKETPLYDLGKVFKSAMDNGRILDRTGPLIEEIGQALKPDSNEYAAFYRWANSSSGIHAIFPASLLVHEKSNDLELNRTIESFWAGDRIKVSDVKNGLRQINQLQSYSFRAPKATELPPQRLRFATELIKGAGYRGWVILLDEIELVGQYSLLQRARSYSELARWLGQASGEAYPGLVVVGTVATDFDAKVLSVDQTSKKDRDYAGQRLRARGDEKGAQQAETAMRLLDPRECIPLYSPSDADVNDTLNTLRYIYTMAYGWDAPHIETGSSAVGYRQRMRYKIRSAINEWDLLRLYPDSRPETEGREFMHQYVEISDLETQSKDDEGETQ